MLDKPLQSLEHIESDVKSYVVCSNLNRVYMLHLLRNSPDQEMQAERMAYRIGLSHRTILYHLDILHDYKLVEVRKFRKRGTKLLRSVWGLRNGNGDLRKIFTKIRNNFDPRELDIMVNKNATHQ